LEGNRLAKSKNRISRFRPELRVNDKKRIAICGGSLGRENRSLVRGQLVDIGIPDIREATDLWDFVTGFFQGEEKDITPFKDFSLAPVRKPVLMIEVYNEKDEKVFESEDFRGNEDGFFSYEIRRKLKPGKYIFHVIFRGSDSYRQYTQDIAYLNIKENSDITKMTIVGIGNLRVLPETYDSYITTSDIDQTYLATELGSKKGMLSTIFETPSEKFYLPGMPELYRAIRKDTNDTPLCFISASPHFFRRTILSTIKAHGIEAESVHLKYLEGTIKGVFDKVMFTLTNPGQLFKEGLSPALERTRKFLLSSYQSLFDQLSYKLTILLQDRIYQPTRAKEILLGDNTESDYLIFSLYQLIIMGELHGKKLEEYLYKLNFLGRDAITRDNARRIVELGSECLALHGKRNSVVAVLINQTIIGPKGPQMEQNVLNALPAGLNIQKIKNFHMFCPTQGALGFAVILHSLGIIQFDSVLSVMKSMVGKYHNGSIVDREYLRSLAYNLSAPEFAIPQRDIVSDILLKAIEKDAPIPIPIIPPVNPITEKKEEDELNPQVARDEDTTLPPQTVEE
jgi:hypothetical protein